MPLLLRPATSADAVACARIYEPYVTGTTISFELTAPNAPEMQRRIEAYSETHAWLVAETPDRRVAGYAYASPHRERAAYRTSADVAVYLDPDWYRQGIARQLYSALFPILRHRGVHAVFAGITLPNAASVGLHEAMGFSLVGIYREVGRKFDAWHDVGWWQKVL